MLRKTNSPASLPRWITFASVTLIVIGILLIFLSRQISDVFTQNVLMGIGFAFAPVGLLVILSEWLIFGNLIQALWSDITDLGKNVKHLGIQTNRLDAEVNSLRVSTDFLRKSSDLGLVMIYTDRTAALADFALFMLDEARRGGDGKVIIVGSSVRGLLESVKDTPKVVKEAIETGCELRILLTHPQYSRYRENQEDRPTGAIEDEIFEGIRKLESCVEVAYPDPPDLKLAPMVKLYKGTPTCFMIVTGDRMLINPYPYEGEAYKNFCVDVSNVEVEDPTKRTIYSEYMRAHFEKPWDRNSVPYRHYWLEGPNPKESWDRDSCYGDVFVVQDAGRFYLAVYLLGQRKAKVRGMPTSIQSLDTTQDESCLFLPNKFIVKLLNANSKTWCPIDIGLLELHADRRRGKTSGEVNGNLLNDNLMLGLFDAEDKVSNPNKDEESTIECLKGNPLPLFYIWLQKK
jgi:hypothetical protein